MGVKNANVPKKYPVNAHWITYSFLQLFFLFTPSRNMTAISKTESS